MITIICGSNRLNSNSLKVAKIVQAKFKEHQVESRIIDLAEIPQMALDAKFYGKTSTDLKKYEDKLLTSDGVITITPEYNGSYPGILKYFLDLIDFPTAFKHKPVAFIGVSAGQFGALTPVAHLQTVFGYCESHIFGQKVYFPRVHKLLSDDGSEITDQFVSDLLQSMLINFVSFVNKLKT